MGLKDALVKAGVLTGTPAPASKASEEDDTKPTPKSKAKVKAAAVEEDTPTVKAGSGSKDFYKTLDKAIRKNSSDHFDYMKFRDTLHSMEKHVPTEEARFGAAGASAEAMKVSPDDLIESAQDYLKLLDKQWDDFNSALAEVEKENDEKEDQLKEINKKLADLQEQKESLEKEVADSRSKTASDKADFSDAYDQLSGEIKQDVSSIKKYLKN